MPVTPMGACWIKTKFYEPSALGPECRDDDWVLLDRGELLARTCAVKGKGWLWALCVPVDHMGVADSLNEARSAVSARLKALRR